VSEHRIARERLREERLAELFQPLTRIGTGSGATGETPSPTLCIQPHTHYSDQRGQGRGDVEARTLDEVTDRLLVVDGPVAFVPAGKDARLAAALGSRSRAQPGYLIGRSGILERGH
jgi:hypothetical protein